MKLAHKITVFLVVGNCLVLGGYGLVARHREVDMLERSMERDTFLAGSTLLATVEQSWSSHGRDEALRLVAHASERQEDMTFRYLETLSQTKLSPAQIATVEQGGRAFERSAGALHMYVPFVDPSGESGVLEVTKDTRDDEAYAQSSTSLLAAATLASALVSGLIAFLVGSTLVGRPMQHLVQRIEKVGSGQLSGRLALGRRDEFGTLAAALDRMSADLQQATEQAETEAAERRTAIHQLRHAERLATVGRLAAGVAHELGTPLNVVMARAKLAEKHAADGAIAKHMGIVREQATRMTQIIQQLLDFARRGDSERTRTNLHAVASKVLEALRPLAAKRSVTLELETSVEAWAHADPGQIQQVITNLVMNAVHASPAGEAVSIALSWGPADPPAQHEGAAGDCWCIEVRDRGPGIPPAIQDQIFEPFFTTKDVGEGTGLGLTVIHGIVAEHEGWIAVDSEEGVGARFRVYLPTPEHAAREGT